MTSDERWKALKTFLTGMILFGKMDRNIGSEIMQLMEQIEEAYPG